MSSPTLVRDNPLLARLALRHHLLVPDGSALVSEEGHPGAPLALATALAASLVGGGAFQAATLVGLQDGLGAPLRSLAPVLGGLLLSGLLTLPPLYLVSALGRRTGSLRQVAAGAAVGPAVAGAWLLASTPVVLLYAPTASDAPAAFGLLVGVLGLLSFLGGAVAAAQGARRAGAASAGVMVILAHYLLAAWTALVLTIHLG